MDEDNKQVVDTGVDASADTSQAQDQVDDWADAEANFLAEKDETGASKPADKGTDEDASKGSDQDEAAKSATDAENADPNKDADLEQKADEGAPQREYRQVQREIEADNKAMRADVQKELYPDWSDDILDADGDPIKTPRDVMARTNPNTGKRFTEEEATAWLFAAQKHKDTQRAERDERIAQVSDTMIDQRDQADQVKGEFGDLLAKLPNLRKEIFADYKATLVIDKETGLIVDAPVSMYKFFERALRPYAEYAKQLQTQAPAADKPKPVQKTTAEVKQIHQDREDIHSASGGSITDPEEDAWAKAAKEYYEG